MIPPFMIDWYIQLRNHVANQLLQIIMDEKKQEYTPLIVKIVQWRDRPLICAGCGEDMDPDSPYIKDERPGIVTHSTKTCLDKLHAKNKV